MKSPRSLHSVGMPWIDVELFREIIVPLWVGGILSLIPGVLITRCVSTFQTVPGLMTLIPALIGMRGNVFGSLAARIASETDSHRLSLSSNTTRAMNKKISFFCLFATVEVVCLSSALPVLVYLTPWASGSFSHLCAVCLLSGLLSSRVMMACTKGVVSFASRNGLDPNNIAPPVITTVGDLITIPLVLISVETCAWIGTWGQLCLMACTGVYVARLLGTGINMVGARTTTRTAKERMPCLFSCMVISLVAGVALEFLMSKTREQTEISAFMSLIPLVNAQAGNAASIVAGRLSTRLTAMMNDVARVSPSGVFSGEFGGAAMNLSQMFRRSSSRNRERYYAGHHQHEEVNGETGSVLSALALVLGSVSVALWMVSPSWTSGIHEVLVVVMAMVMVISSTSTLLGRYAVRVAMSLRIHPDNIAIPVVCALMDVVASWGYTLMVFIMVHTSNYMEGTSMVETQHGGGGGGDL